MSLSSAYFKRTHYNGIGNIFGHWLKNIFSIFEVHKSYRKKIPAILVFGLNVR